MNNDQLELCLLVDLLIIVATIALFQSGMGYACSALIGVLNAFIATFLSKMAKRNGRNDNQSR